MSAEELNQLTKEIEQLRVTTRRLNQCTRITNKIKAEFSKEHDSANLIEPTFRGHEIDCKEPDDPGDEASRVELMRWELGMRDHYENNKLIKEGLFSLWAYIIGQSSDLANTKLKALNEH